MDTRALADRRVHRRTPLNRSLPSLGGPQLILALGKGWGAAQDVYWRPPTARRPPVDRPSTARRPPADRPSTVRRPSADRPSTARRPPVDRPSTARRPSADRPPTARRPPANRSDDLAPS